jgi:curved DNA-binding protein CbpA
MSSVDALRVFLGSIDRKSYYDILRVGRDADAGAVKRAFHDFSLLYHPDRYVGAPPQEAEVASEIFKRGVEAYRCLSRKPTRERYDKSLARGKLRSAAARPSTLPPPPPPVRTLEDVARTPRAKQLALKADRLISAGKLDDARVALVSACQDEPDNAELAERLQIIYEVLALEPD